MYLIFLHPFLDPGSGGMRENPAGHDDDPWFGRRRSSSIFMPFRHRTVGEISARSALPVQTVMGGPRSGLTVKPSCVSTLIRYTAEVQMSSWLSPAAWAGNPALRPQSSMSRQPGIIPLQGIPLQGVGVGTEAWSDSS